MKYEQNINQLSLISGRWATPVSYITIELILSTWYKYLYTILSNGPMHNTILNIRNIDIIQRFKVLFYYNTNIPIIEHDLVNKPGS